MTERRGDNNNRWTYKTRFPGADFRQNQVGIQHPRLVESTGVDGRFLGAIRPFPGMADTTVHGVPKPEAGQTITSISNIVLARYVSIQKGATRYTLKGIAYVADNPSSTGSAIYFAYRDSEDGSDDVVMLEDFKSWTDFTLDTLIEFDIASMGKYIYFVCSGDTSSTPLSKWNTKEPPYNKAYFFDWKINTWDAFDRNGTGFEGRFMSVMPTRLLEGAINEDTNPELASGNGGATTASNTTINLSADNPDLSSVAANDLIKLRGVTSDLAWAEELIINTVDNGADTVTVTVAPQLTATSVVWSIRDNTTLLSEDSMDFQVYGPIFTMPKGNYTGAIELISRKHNLRSLMRFRTIFAIGTTNSGLRYEVAFIRLPTVEGASGQTNQLRGDNINSTCILYWGIPHVDGFRFWRTTGDGATSSGDQDKYTIVKPLYLVDSYREKGVYQAISGILILQFEHAPDYAETGVFDGTTTFYSDAGLVTQTKYDALQEAFGAAPRMKRIVQYNGLLVGVTDIAEPSTLNEADWDKSDQRTEELCWSHTGKLEPENFPPENRFPPEDPGEKFFSLEAAGDHLFGVANSSVYQITRTGSSLSLMRVLSRLGGVSRFAHTGVGNTLFIVTKAGVKSIDGNTRAVKSISAMDRIIMDDGEWAGSLADVHLEYDATLGVLVFLNTTKKECFLLWEATGAITRLVDCPWVFLAGGGDVLTSGPQRVYFIRSTGEIHCIDGAREMGKRSMCGTGAGETVNGTCTTGSATQIIDSTATFPLNCVGHQVYLHNGNLSGDNVVIASRDSATTLTVTGLSEATVTTTRYSIAPVVTELVFQQLGGAGGDAEKDVIDPFVRKVVTSISVAFSDLGGETLSSDVNSFIRMGVWRNRQRLTEIEEAIDIIPDKCVARVNASDVRVYPSLRFLSGNVDFELQAMIVHGLLCPSEAQSRQS